MAAPVPQKWVQLATALNFGLVHLVTLLLFVILHLQLASLGFDLAEIMLSLAVYRLQRLAAPLSFDFGSELRFLPSCVATDDQC
jgi:hypothetical protein